MEKKKMSINSKVYYLKELWDIDTCRDAMNDNDGLFMEFAGYQGVFRNDVLNMVGMFYGDDGSIIYSCPKYFDEVIIKSKTPDNENKIKEHMGLIVRVLEKLRNEGKNIKEVGADFFAYERRDSIKRVNRINLAEYIVKDYIENGIYYIDERKASLTRGKVKWGETIKKITPIIDGSSVLYSTQRRISKYKDYNNIYSFIHNKIINRCLEFLHGLNMYNNLKCEDMIQYSNEDVDCFSFSKVLERELPHLFTARAISLFRALISWCKESVYYKTIGCTTDFQNVWEWCNDSVFGNLGKDDGKESNPPVYILNKEEYIGEGTAKPDTIYKDKSGKNLAIFDSKYYIPYFAKNKVGNLPGNADIAKQVAYLNQIKRYLKDDWHYSNAFLLPYCKSYEKIQCSESDVWEYNALYKKIGYVEGSLFDKIAEPDGSLGDKQKVRHDIYNKYNKVDLYLINPEELYEKFLSDYKISTDNINEFVGFVK